MKKLIIGVLSAAVLAFGLVPAQAATEYLVNQKTLASFSASATGLTTLQRSQVEAAVEANPNAEKFICTGIRYVSQPMSENIKVRKRAKAACDYAKQLNPALSTWFQNKPTNARSYAGKVLLTIKTDQDLVGSSSTLSASYPYPACDTTAKQPLTRVQDKNWQIYGAECATDRTLPTTALERVVTSGPMEPCMLKETSPERVR